MKLVLHLGGVAEVLRLGVCNWLLLMVLLLRLLLVHMWLLVLLLWLDLLLRLDVCVQIAHAQSSHWVLNAEVDMHV